MNLPSLGALRAFQATARHLSVTQAAGELNVTPVAVSLQIKELGGGHRAVCAPAAESDRRCIAGADGQERRQ